MGGLRPLLSAELLSIGSEITVGETRDTNAGDLARSLSGIGIVVRRIQALPDDLDAVSGAFADALERADLVISTGGLGPTPDDLTREAIAAVVGEKPTVDPDLESWLRGLWSRRGMTMPDMNLKQAWLIPSAEALPNANGTAPAWWVSRPDGRLIVALPGPPREMRPIWSEQVLPRLRERGAGGEVGEPDVPIGWHRRVGGGGAPGRGAPPVRQSGRCHVCPRRCGRRSDLGPTGVRSLESTLGAGDRRRDRGAGPGPAR